MKKSRKTPPPKKRESWRKTLACRYRDDVTGVCRRYTSECDSPECDKRDRETETKP